MATKPRVGPPRRHNQPASRTDANVSAPPDQRYAPTRIFAWLLGMVTVHSAAERYRHARWLILGQHREELQAAQARLRKALRQAGSTTARQAAWQAYERDAAPIRQRTRAMIHEAREDFRQAVETQVCA